MTEWQPIETAPRDSSEVLVFSNSVTATASFGVHHEKWLATWDGDLVYDSKSDIVEVFDPTHWMPLPEKPKTESL